VIINDKFWNKFSKSLDGFKRPRSVSRLYFSRLTHLHNFFRYITFLLFFNLSASYGKTTNPLKKWFKNLIISNILKATGLLLFLCTRTKGHFPTKLTRLRLLLEISVKRLMSCPATETSPSQWSDLTSIYIKSVGSSLIIYLNFRV